MVFRQFRILCAVRVLLIAATCGLVAWLVVSTTMYASIAVAILLLIYQAYSLIRFVERTNRDIERFLEAIEYSDFSDRFSTGLQGHTFDELNTLFARVSQRFRDLRLDREESLHYLRAVVQHVGIGLIAFTEDGTVELVNNAARRLLRASAVNRLDDLLSVGVDVVDRLLSAETGKPQLITLRGGSEPQHLSVMTTRLKLRERQIVIASFQNITSELSAREMDAWQNLIRVLTHEIRNSLTPISSLAATIEQNIADGGLSRPEPQTTTRQEMIEALGTIRRRSDGLLGFVDSYRRLTRIPNPNFAPVRVRDLQQDTVKLAEPLFAGLSIRLTCSVEPEDLELLADAQMIGQVLLNLVKNAVEAVGTQNDAVVEMRAFRDSDGRVRITVTDNGPGVAEEALDQIFVPLYTTKKGGSGIGLSLSRQIMRLHNGGLTVASEPGRQTVFTMVF